MQIGTHMPCMCTQWNNGDEVGQWKGGPLRASDSGARRGQTKREKPWLAGLGR
eukprot:jgi/Botrbrau1/8499/Bobra.0029s0007.1